MKDVAVVILNWNGVGFLEQFLEKVVACSDDAQIVVADNASTDTSVDYISTNYPNIRIVQNSENGGFAKGYNDALKQVQARFYILLNSDVEVTPGWIQPLLRCMQDENVTGCQPKIRAFDRKDHFEYAGASGGFLDHNYFPFCRGRIFNVSEEDHGQYDNPMEVFWITGAAFMIRAEAFHKVGGFDASFFAHMEEIDLCWRLKKQGGSFKVIPESIVYHVGGGSLSYASPRKTYLNFRNNLKMLIKNHEGWLFPKLFWRMSLDGAAGMLFLVKGEFGNFFAVFKAHMHIYGHLRTLIKQRIAIRRSSSQFNASGLFKGNLIWNFYFKKVKRFADLNQRLFK